MPSFLMRSCSTSSCSRQVAHILLSIHSINLTSKLLELESAINLQREIQRFSIRFCFYNGGGQILRMSLENSYTALHHFILSRESFFNLICSSTCLLRVMLGCLRFLLPSSLKCNTLLNIFALSLFKTSQYHCIPFALVNLSKFFSKLRKSTNLRLFLSFINLTLECPGFLYT